MSSGGGTIDFRWRMLCEIADISTGNSNTNEAVEDGKYPFFVRSQEPLRKNDFEYDEAAIITAGDGGSIEGGGYIWHTTGSGKTLTSFKTARLASQLPYILILKNQQATSTTAISWKNEHPQIASLNKFV